MRRNIFQLLADEFDMHHEIKNIYDLLKSDLIRRGHHTNWSVMDIFESDIFWNWKQRGRCVSPDDFFDRLEIPRIVETPNPNINDIQIFLEFSSNMMELCKQFVNSNNEYSYDQEFPFLEHLINSSLNHINMTTYYFKDEEKVVLITDNHAALAVAEIIDENLIKDVIQYNHFILKGNLALKKKIICSLANDLEPKRPMIKAENSEVEDNLFFLLNNLNIRHNNIDPSNLKHYKEVVAKMNDDELENWYDELYQLELLAFLLLENSNRSNEIKELKKLI